MSSCPCGSGAEFENCCGPLLGGAPAATPEALMRSRYTAFVRKDLDHIEATQTQDPEEEAFDRKGAEEMANTVTWTGLQILSTGGADTDDTGTVEFAARFKQGGQVQLHHELASFRRQDGRWIYVDGIINPKSEPRKAAKVGRNDPCPCGSGKKYKKCCGA